MSHTLAWQDGYMAQLVKCGGVRIRHAVILHVDGNLLPEDYGDQLCPVCRKRIQLIWDVRAVVRGAGRDDMSEYCAVCWGPTPCQKHDT
jgi:hypothetical protein